MNQPPPPHRTPPFGEISINPLALINSKLDAIDSKVEAHRKESASRNDDQRSHNERVSSRLEELEKGHSSLRQAHTEIVGLISKIETDHADAIGKDIAEELKVRQLATRLQGIGDQLAANERVNRGLSQALGVDFDALQKPPASLSQTQQIRAGQHPDVTLGTLSRQQKLTATSSVIAIVILVLELALKLLH